MFISLKNHQICSNRRQYDCHCH